MNVNLSTKIQQEYTPAKIYSNADTEKLNILKDNKGKSVISM